MTKQNHDATPPERDRPAHIEGYNGRGVWVPAGLTAAEIMIGAAALERDFDVAPYTSRNMVIAVLQALRSVQAKDETL